MTARKGWTSKEEVEGFKDNLIALARLYAWRRGNAKWAKWKEGMETTQEKEDKAMKLLREGRFSAGHAALARIRIEEAALKILAQENEAEFLEKLDALGIDREWKANDADDPMPKLLFHFALSGGTKHTLDLTKEEI